MADCGILKNFFKQSQPNESQPCAQTNTLVAVAYCPNLTKLDKSKQGLVFLVSLCKKHPKQQPGQDIGTSQATFHDTRPSKTLKKCQVRWNSFLFISRVETVSFQVPPLILVDLVFTVYSSIFLASLQNVK